MTIRAAASGSVQRVNKKRRDHILALATLGLIVLVWIASAVRAEADLLPTIEAVMPETDHVSREANGLYAPGETMPKRCCWATSWLVRPMGMAARWS